MKIQAINRLFTSALAIVLLQTLVLSDARAAAAAGYWEYFIPGNEVDLRAVYNDLGPINNSLGNTIIGVSAWTR